MTKESYTLEQIKKAMIAKSHRWFENGEFNVNIVGIRNAATGDKITNKFDDFMTMAYINEAGEWKFECFPCTTDPGKHWTEHLLNPNGVAILKEGQYRGSHKIRKHRGQYNALCQKGAVKVYRDKDINDEYDLLEENVDEGIYGINIHKAGSRKNGSTQIDKWSAGCQVFSKESDFNIFMDVMYKAKEKWGNSFTYTLINSKDIS
jgi:hypothetical protein